MSFSLPSPEDHAPVAAAEQGQMVCLYGVVAEGHVSHEVAEVSGLHQPLPSCRRRRASPSHRACLVGTHSLGGMGGRWQGIRGSEGRVLRGVKGRTTHIRIHMPQITRPLPPTFLASDIIPFQFS